MLNFITQKEHDKHREGDYWDWQFESINFQWLPKRGVWHMGAYDINEYFTGKIEGQELTRCVCNDSQFTHFMLDDSGEKRMPLCCPICEPEPTPPPPPSMCIVNDEWHTRESFDGGGWFIHNMNCEAIRYKRNQLTFYDKNTPITEEGFETIALNLMGDIMYERDEFYDIPEDFEPIKGVIGQWRQYFNLKRATEAVTAEIKMFAKGCRYNCMEKHMEESQ